MDKSKIKVWKEHCFALCSLHTLYPCSDSLPLNLLTCRWASNKSDWPNRGLAAGTLQFIGRVPKPCSKSRIGKSSSGDEGVAKFFRLIFQYFWLIYAWATGCCHLGSFLIESEKTFTIKVDQMCWRLSNPDFCLPRNVIQVFQHSPSIKKRGHKNQASGRCGEQFLQFLPALRVNRPVAQLRNQPRV